MKIIMVQMWDRRWTLEAMHLASALARNSDGNIVLLCMQPAHNPGLLGWHIEAPTENEQRQMGEYGAVAEDYGVGFCIQPMQYITYAEALAQAVEQNQVSDLFAHIPQTHITPLRWFRLWDLKRRLGNCQLHTLDNEKQLVIKEQTRPSSGHVKTTAH
jgi:hypothetical protein